MFPNGHSFQGYWENNIRKYSQPDFFTSSSGEVYRNRWIKAAKDNQENNHKDEDISPQAIITRKISSLTPCVNILQVKPNTTNQNSDLGDVSQGQNYSDSFTEKSETSQDSTERGIYYADGAEMDTNHLSCSNTLHKSLHSYSSTCAKDDIITSETEIFQNETRRYACSVCKVTNDGDNILLTPKVTPKVTIDFRKHLNIEFDAIL